MGGSGMRLPDFLIIGAQKAGTTTLYRDLGAHPGIYFSFNKEPNILCDDDALSDKGRRYYATLFEAVGEGQLCAEASTAYTKLPDVAGVADRAKAVLGEKLKVIYVVRNPVERTVSHHYHDYMAGLAPGDFDAAVRQMPRFVNYSRYAMQMEPWLGALGGERVRVVQFEDYVKDRGGQTAALHRFLGLAEMPDVVDQSVRYNVAEEKLVSRSILRSPQRWLSNNRWYRNRLRPLIPEALIGGVKRLVMRRPPHRPVVKDAATIDWLIEQLEPEARRLGQLLGAGSPQWDFQQTRASWRQLLDRASEAGQTSGE
jgi:Sulfotransferase domain